jgi:hypothetical protein
LDGILQQHDPADVTIIVSREGVGSVQENNLFPRGEPHGAAEHGAFRDQFGVTFQRLA